MTTGRSMTKRTAIAAAVIATVAGAGLGIARASIPDGSGVVHTCYPTSGSLKAMFVVDSPTTTCPAGFSALALNQTGPQGPPGATGPQGVTGPQGGTGARGPAGPSAAYSASHSSGVGLMNGATVVSVSVPAGSYVVTAKTTILNGPDDNRAECTLANGANALDQVFLRLPPGPQLTATPPSATIEVSLEGVATLAVAGTLSLQCSTEVAALAAGSPFDTGGGGPAHITAIRVGALH